MEKTTTNSSYKKYKKPLLIAICAILMILILGGAFAFAKREALLKQVINKAIATAKSRYDLNVKIGSFGFSGLSALDLKDISVIPEGRDSLATIKDFRVGVKLWPLIVGKVKISELGMTDAIVSFIKKDSISNYDFLFKDTEDPDTLKNDKKVDLSELANKLLNEALDKIPEDMKIERFLIRYDHDTTHFSLLTEKATIQDGKVESTLKLNENEAVWHLNGSAAPSDKQLDLKFFADKKKVEFPYLERKYGLKLNFDTVRTIMTGADKSGDKFEIDGSWSVNNLLINHQKIASHDVIVKSGSIDAKILVGENYLALDSSSVIYLGKAQMSPFIKYTLGKNKIYELQLHAMQQPAQNIFDAFPIGLFESLEGMKVTGKLKYDLNFYLDGALPDSVIFNSTLKGSNDFKIFRYGQVDFTKINSVFTYTPFEKGKPVRPIIVGPQNPNYTPIDDISPNVKNALMTSEDPSFFNHKGFVEESIRQSIATNYKEKYFKRGGSTISMQLVKNVYLNRSKTIARKIEEILIVWLIENEHLVTKSRMFEVYLNIIEWGRNVYGIGEAANYYFGKSPSQLTIGESIYLAHIVPKPKSSLYAWQPNGALKSSLHGYYRLIGGLMARRGYTYNDSTTYGFYGVRIKENLRQQIAPADYVMESDTTDEEGGDFFEIFKPSVKDTIAKKENYIKKLPSLPENKSLKVDTVVEKTVKQLRQERREARRKEIN